MKKIIMRGFIILSIYLLFGLYLVLVGNRVEKLNISYDTVIEVMKDSNNVSTIFVR